MSSEKHTHTPGPWRVKRIDYPRGLDVSFEVLAGKELVAQTIMREIGEGWRDDIIAVDAANAGLMAAAPRLVDALKGMIGLCQLVRNRGDLPTEARQALTHNHRIIAAYEALSAAGINGFQPSDFDAAKAKEPRP